MMQVAAHDVNTQVEMCVIQTRTMRHVCRLHPHGYAERDRDTGQMVSVCNESVWNALKVNKQTTHVKMSTSSRMQ